MPQLHLLGLFLVASSFHPLLQSGTPSLAISISEMLTALSWLCCGGILLASIVAVKNTIFIQVIIHYTAAACVCFCLGDINRAFIIASRMPSSYMSISETPQSHLLGDVVLSLSCLQELVQSGMPSLLLSYIGKCHSHTS